MIGTLREDQYTFLITTRSVLLRRRNFSDKSFREKTILSSVNFFFQNRNIYEKIIVERVRPQVTIWHIYVAWRIPMATNTHTHRISNAVPQQQWLHERASILHYMYFGCHVYWYMRGQKCFIGLLVANTFNIWLHLTSFDFLHFFTFGHPLVTKISGRKDICRLSWGTLNWNTQGLT